MSDQISRGRGIVQRVRMPPPDQMPTTPPQAPSGRYNASGEADPAGNVFIVMLGPTAQAWAVFDDQVQPRQTATMIFENVAGDGILDVIVTQWIDGGSGMLGDNFNQPHAGEAAIVFLARQRKPGAVKVVGSNSSDAAVNVAAGLLYIPGTGG